jgi:hypothetical protein
LGARPSDRARAARIALPVLGEGELDGGHGVTGFEGADFGLADSVKFLEGKGASAAAGGEIGRERGDALKEVLGSVTEIEDHRFLRSGASRLGKGAPGSGLFRILEMTRPPKPKQVGIFHSNKHVLTR